MGVFAHLTLEWLSGSTKVRLKRFGRLQISQGNAMTSAMKGFDHSRAGAMTMATLLMHIAVCSFIVPCLVAIGLSQKLHDWPPQASTFKLWS